MSSYQRIAAPLSSEDYREAIVAFQTAWSGDHEALLDFVATHAPTTSQGNDLHVLSLGAGDGLRDVAALSVLRDVCQPAQIFYSALEPNGAQLAALTKYFSSHVENIDLRAFQLKAEHYDFPEMTFDVIFFTHSLYHMPGAERDLLEKALLALKPDGRMIITLATEQGGIPKLKSAFSHIIEYSHFKAFGQESLLEILEMHYDSSQYHFEALPNVYIDASACFDADSHLGRNLLNFILQADVSKLPDEIAERVLKTLDGMAPESDDGSRRLPHGSGLFLITAQE